jgi:magnesium transporter
MDPTVVDEAESSERLTADELREAWPVLDLEERLDGFRLLTRENAENFFLQLSSHGQAVVLRGVPVGERRGWLRLLPPDDVADVIPHIPEEERGEYLQLLDDSTRREVSALLAYDEDRAGGLMNPRFARVRPEMTVDEAIRYVRRQATDRLEMIYYVYVLDAQQRLGGVVSFRELLLAPGERQVREVMRKEVVSVGEEMDQESVARLIAQHDLLAVPVVDAGGSMKGIVTVDDVVDIVQEEATEDIHKFGGMQALGTPYLRAPFASMVKKRAGWLAALFLGEMLTATAMAYFQAEIARAVVLALFVPLIISSGGNSGSQASTLVIRAMALGEVKLRDWWRVVRREIGAGIALGSILGAIGFLRIILWQAVRPLYGEHYLLVACTVCFSLLGVVAFGTLAGSILPFVLRRLGFDPASASAPFVATLVDVTGLVIYFSVAAALLQGTLL